MFRYIALLTSLDNPGAAALARTLVDSLTSVPHWEPALRTPGLDVFCVGAVAGINQAYKLGEKKGVVLGRLFRRHEPDAKTRDITSLLATSHDVVESGGRALIESYWGRYVAFFESPDGGVHVLRDPSGTLPCYWLRQEGVTIVFSWIEDVLCTLRQIPIPNVSVDGLAAYLAFGELTGRLSALKDVNQVLAGELATFSRTGERRSCLLWSAAELALSPLDVDMEDAVPALRDAVTTCVQGWAGCYDSILLRLSGGVDSSILASCLAEFRAPARITCLNYHSVGADSDERHFARLAASMAKRELIERERDSAFRLERILDVARTPTPNNYVGRISSSSDAEIAAAVGAPAMFTGSGGDQLFFEVRQWWPAADHLRLRGLDAAFPAAALDAARLGRVSVWKAMRLAVGDRLRKRPPVSDLHTHRVLITDRVRQQSGCPAGFMHPVFVLPTTLPIGKLSQVQQLAYPAGYYDPFSREKAPELVHPLLSQPLIELCLGLPTFLLTAGGRGRALARKAFEGEIPTQIARRRSKGGMEEHVKAVLARNLDFGRQLLLDGELIRLGLIDRSAVEAALSDRQPDKRTPVGEIHFCIGIEAWLQRWSRQRCQPA